MEAAADYYAMLSVDPGADDATIRRAYRDLMRRYHPDVNATDEAAAKAQALNEAYACLRDPDERAHYDRLRQARQKRPTFTAADPTAPMGASMGAARAYAQPGRAAWSHQHTYIVDEDQVPQPTRWKAASLALAAVITVVTFTITSAIPSVMPPPADAAVVVRTEVGAQAATGPSVAEVCRKDPAERPAICGTPPKSPAPNAR